MGEIEERIRIRVAQGRLPAIPCLVVWAADGRGERCAACDTRIRGSEMNVECDVEGGGRLSFHVACYRAWHAEISVPS
jgi:hypothetical protein